MATRAAAANGRRERRETELEMGMLRNLIGYNLRVAQLSVFRHFGATVGKDGISPPQLGAMMLIEANPGVSQSAVAEALRFDRSTLVQIVDRLEQRGLVRRDAAPQDRRSHALHLTAKGEKALTSLKADLLAHEADIAATLNSAEREELVRMLDKIHRRSA